jgi:hypothetical protein
VRGALLFVPGLLCLVIGPGCGGGASAAEDADGTTEGADFSREGDEGVDRPDVLEDCEEVPADASDGADGTSDAEPDGDDAGADAVWIPCGSEDGGSSCPDDLVCCSGYCWDLATSHDHCGNCDRECEPVFSCVAQDCVCAPPSIWCGPLCVDPRSTNYACGSCDHACTALESCIEGVCICPSHRLCDGVCTDLENDVHNCGSCGHECLVCSGGVCTP